MFRRAAVLLVPLIVLGAPTVAPASPASPAPTTAVQPPNVIVMVLDDATFADVDKMPHVQRLLADKGTTFERNYAPMPLCCPARATLLTGLYPHNHHVLDNVAPYGGFGAFDDTNTIATYLDPAYRTQIVGKYLNDFENVEANDLTYQSPGWDDWRVAVKDVYNYVAQGIAINGTVRDFTGYMPAIYSRFTQRFVENTPTTTPWFSYLSWVDPHKGLPHEGPNDPKASPYVPRRLRGSITGRVLPRDPSINEGDVSDKSTFVASLPKIHRRELHEVRKQSKQRREALEPVDHWVGKIVHTVAARGEMQNTYFILVSDNGYMQGQHRIFDGKEWPYEPGARVPTIIRGPGFPAGLKYDATVTGLQDITPTILDVTGQPLPSGAPTPDGLSLRGLVDGTITTSRPEVIEIAKTMGVSDGVSSAQAAARHPRRLQALLANGVGWRVRGVVTSDGWKYFTWGDGEAELYNLNTDPYELDNLATDPAYLGEVIDLQSLLNQYENCAGATCH